MLYRIIYCSRCACALTGTDLLKIMQASEANNSVRDLTGVLCYGNGRFLQVLEGDRTPLNETYHRIAADPRHADVEILSAMAIDARMFTKWSMRLVDLADRPEDEISQMVLQFTHRPVFAPQLLTSRQALALAYGLYRIWHLPQANELTAPLSA